METSDLLVISHSLKACCSRVTTPKFGPKFGPLNFNIVLMLTGTLMGRMSLGPIQSEFQSDLANWYKHNVKL